jgi:uncharacterized protein (UPF0305 family)
VCVSCLLKVDKIKSSELFLKLKQEIERYTSLVKPEKKIDDELQGKMSDYNLENFKRLTRTSYVGVDDEIDTDKLEDLKHAIDHYFALYAPHDDEFKEFIKIISIYLTFIEKKPLHSPGIVFSGGRTVYQKGKIYYCTGKKYFKKEEESLCNFCVCLEV